MTARFPKRYADFVARLRIEAGFAMALGFSWLSHPSLRSLEAGLPVALAGLGLRAWAAGSLYKDRELATAGPYAYTRNPLYLGTLTVAAGFTIASRNAWLALLTAAVFGLIYLPAIELEQQHLAELFPQYGLYAERVPMLLPRPGKQMGPGPFRWAQYWNNREYQAGLGFAAGAAWLIWKAFH